MANAERTPVGRWCAAAAALALGACTATARPLPDAPIVSDVETPDAGPGPDVVEGGGEGAAVPPGRAMPDAPRDPRGPSLPAGTDADDDRVADAVDECPKTPPDAPVDARGCALFERVLDGVSFATGDHSLGAEARRALDRLIADLERHPEVRIRLEGHTDNRGTALSNLELSKERVMSVARYLVAGGISPSRLKPYGYGESRPLAGNRTAAGRERNRRIEIGPPGAP